MSEGKVFQSVGAATEKDLAQYVFKLKVTNVVDEIECKV